MYQESKKLVVDIWSRNLHFGNLSSGNNSREGKKHYEHSSSSIIYNGKEMESHGVPRKLDGRAMVG